MTGADRTWAARYTPGDVIQYGAGSKANGIERGSFATVRAVDAHANLLTVELANGTTLAYDPRRLRGVNVFREQEREFATGDRIQFTGRLKEYGVANRDLATIKHIEDGRVTVLMDGKQRRTLTFNASTTRLFDHGYAVTSHSSQGLTAGRVIAHFDTEGPRSLINSRLAYVAISRASEDAQIYTNDSARLGRRLSTDISKTAAVSLVPESAQTNVQRAVTAFRKSHPSTATDILREQGQLHSYATSEDRLASVARAYSSQSGRTVVFAPDANERRDLTQLIRHELVQQGRLSSDSHTLPVWVERHLDEPRLAANYSPGDRIHFRTGSPIEHGIADNSEVTVLSIDAKANRLTVASRDGNEVNYNPAHLRRQTYQSSIFREEQREISEGERIRFTAVERQSQIRTNDLATVEQVRNGQSLAVRTDQGKTIVLSQEQSRMIDYGYAVDTISNRGVDRVIVTGDSTELAQHQQDLARLPSHTRDLSIYASGGNSVAQGKSIKAAVPALGMDNGVTLPPPDISIPGYGRGR
ncbi:MAG: hypothetical protein PW792_10655 [Acidobacteriaceae bacterium]|nr:hypothetical protein [Acidobacteriaceae bacterium]